MTLDLLQYILGALSGSLVGLSLGLFGGGGSILAVPLMVYIVGVPTAHMAVGTSAFAVAVNAAASLVGHARIGTVKWRCALMFSVAGVAGAAFGSTLGKAFDGNGLLALFAVLMMVVGALMFRSRGRGGDPDVQCTRQNLPAVTGYGGAAGALSGFFGIGGGFLIVPALIAATGMTTLQAVGSSLVGITAFGLTTAGNYALSGLVDWPLALVFIAGGAVGGLAGGRLARQIAGRKGLLDTLFAILIFVVALYMLWKSAGSLGLL